MSSVRRGETGSLSRSSGSLLIAVLALLSVTAAAALDPDKSIDQYVRSSWTTEDGLPQNSINDIVQTRDGYLWIGTSGGLARFDGVRFRIFDVATDPVLGSNRVMALYEDREGRLWIGSRDGHVITWRDGVFTAFEGQHELPPGGVQGFHEDDAGALWITLTNHQVLWPPTPGGLEVVRRSLSDAGSDEELRLRDRDGNLWRTRGGELQRLPATAELATAPEPPDSLVFDAGSTILSLFEDREGNLWIGTVLNGLQRLHDGAVTSYRGRHGFTDERVRSIFEAANGDIWLGGFATGFFRFRDGSFTHVDLPPGFGVGRTVIADRAGHTWFAGSEGLARLEDGRIAAAWPGESLPGTGAVYALYEDRDGTIWVGLQDRGLGRIVEDELKIFTTGDGLVDDDVHFITEDRRGALWIGTYRGMSRFDGERFTNYTTAEDLPFEYVRAIHEDDAGVLWIGTYGGGLARFENGRVTTLYSTKNGLPENTVSRILTDDDGYFWFSGNRGLTRVEHAVLERYARGEIDRVVATLYGRADGMSVSETFGGTQPAGWKASDGRLWFPALRGAVVVDPARLRPDRPPPVQIDQVLVDREEVPVSRKLTVGPGNTSLEVRYTALQFALPREARFRYRLVGLDERWIEVGDRRVAYYSPLPPGSYRFEVQAAAYAGGEWSETRSFELTLRPHLWQVLWFQALLVVALGAAAFHLRTRRIHARNRALQAEITARRRLEADREQLLREMDANRVLSARLAALDQLAADDTDGDVARLADGLARQERLYAKLLRAESPAHLAALRDELAELAEEARDAPALHPDFLAELHRVLERLEPLERLPTGEDRALVLGEALTRALAMQEQRERPGRDPRERPALGDMALESVRQVFATALQELHRRAELHLRLRSKQVNVRQEAVLVLEIENVGQGNARNLAVTLASEGSALAVRRPRQHLPSLQRGQSARLEFLVEPRESERVRVVFRVAYDDPERSGKELEFADLVELRRIRAPERFRPLRPNPYVVGRPLLASDPFFGRGEIFERLASSLQGAEQDNVVVLIGQRRMGKTSILRRLDAHLPARYLPVLVDLQGFLGRGEAAFFADLAGQVTDELEARGVRVREPPAGAFHDDPSGLFRRRFLADVRATLDGRRLLLVFDEMEVLEERIAAGELTPRILPFLRSLMQHDSDVSFLLAGTHRLDELTADYWGVLFNLAVYLDVGNLSESDVRSLFEEPTRGCFEIDELALDKVYRTTGGHPHFSQLLARELVELCNRQKISYATIQDVNRVIDVVAERGQLHIAYLWDESSPGERRLLLAVRELLEHQGVASFRAAREYLEGRGGLVEDLSDALRRLRRKEILAEEAGQLSFRIDLLRRWLDRHREPELFDLGLSGSPG